MNSPANTPRQVKGPARAAIGNLERAAASSPAQTDSPAQENAAPLLSLEHIRKSFDDVCVLQDISVQVSKGEVLAVIGPSGSGKSTLLRCATLLESFESGRLSYGDLVIAEDNAQGQAVYASKHVQKQARARFGLVFQNFNLFPHFTVMRNIASAPMRVQRRPKEEVHEQARALLAKMGLSGKEDMMPCELSGGQQQRVAIARALALNPEVLFFDEPTSALDPELTWEVLTVIRNLAAEHMTMVIVTHEMFFARDVADRIIFMEDGAIVEEGRASDLINDPRHQRTKAFLSTYAAKR
ncbi:MAG: amino acid ABC transporter ATP-binding protein [Eggerthellaceae bacterium]|jgi:polar amino acid transport system ATP-binding protein|nr:amino acid ABC transporter ATP-binding protein [Eggerthellaceae bacterium]MDR2716271.1 amino acid ABC transporter ATP-binding protein [Coriobacteriaceae bacterium]